MQVGKAAAMTVDAHVVDAKNDLSPREKLQWPERTLSRDALASNRVEVMLSEMRSEAHRLLNVPMPGSRPFSVSSRNSSFDNLSQLSAPTNDSINSRSDLLSRNSVVLSRGHTPLHIEMDTEGRSDQKLKRCGDWTEGLSAANVRAQTPREPNERFLLSLKREVDPSPRPSAPDSVPDSPRNEATVAEMELDCVNGLALLARGSRKRERGF